MSDSTTFPMTNFIKLSLSLMVALVLISVFVGIYGWWVSPQLKSDGNAENVLEELIALIEAQEGDEWSVETFILSTKSYKLIAFSSQDPTYPDPKYEKRVFSKNCDAACICVFKILDDKIERLACKNLPSDANTIAFEPTIGTSPFVHPDFYVEQYSCNVYSISYKEKITFALTEECSAFNEKWKEISNQQIEDKGGRKSPI